MNVLPIARSSLPSRLLVRRGMDLAKYPRFPLLHLHCTARSDSFFRQGENEEDLGLYFLKMSIYHACRTGHYASLSNKTSFGVGWIAFRPNAPDTPWYPCHPLLIKRPTQRHDHHFSYRIEVICLTPPCAGQHIYTH